MVGIKSDVGNVRKINEDYAIYSKEEEYVLYIVADGMGGHNAGEVASKMASEKVKEFIDNELGLDEDKYVLENAIKYANKEVYNYSLQNDSLKGMGTTLVVCLETKVGLKVANVGDSCCFGIKDNKFIKITKDHSLVQELLDSGTITEEEAKNHCRRNVITRAVGTREKVNVDIFEVNKMDFDYFLMCSDGLSNDLSTKDIGEILNQEKCLDKACNNLISLAKAKGGRDNITVILFGGEV